MKYISLLQENYQWLLTLLLILIYPGTLKFVLRLFERTIAERNGARGDKHRINRARWLIKTAMFTLLLLTILILWGIELRGLLVVGSSLFALLGVGLFASWSLLSNVTSFLVLFIQDYFRVGFWVRIIDGANFVEGRITDMTFLNVVLETVEGDRILYPNNLFIVRPVIVLKQAPQKAVKKPDRKQLPSGVSR